jgi:hypothetical protein
VLRTAQLAAHQVGQHLGDGQAQAAPGAAECAGAVAAREGLEDRASSAAHAGAGVLDIDHAISRA